MFNLTLMYSGYPLIEVQRLAVELLQLLDQRFFGDENLQFNPDETLNEANSTIGEKRDSDPLESSFLKSQVYLSQQLATLHPEMTIPMFSGKPNFSIERRIFLIMCLKIIENKNLFFFLKK